MGLKRRYKIVFTRETVTDEGIVVKQKPPICGQILENEEMLQMLLVPEVIVEQTILQRLYDGIKAELENPNAYLNKKDISKEVKVEEPSIKQNIIPLNSQFANQK